MSGMILPESPRVRAALVYAMKRLASKSRLSFEIARDLISREYSESEIEEVLSFLQRHKLLDDKKTIQSLIERKSGKSSVGKGKMRAELLQRGAPDEMVEESLAEWTDEAELKAMHAALSGRHWPAGSRVRAARFLLSRGFDEDLVESSLDRFFGVD